MPAFSLSTKVGFFPAGAGSEHSLDPARLRCAVYQSVDDLGLGPDLIFLHSPERSLAKLTPVEAHDRLTTACSVLVDAKASRMCGSWGIASWDVVPLLSALETDDESLVPPPDVVMVRAGLSVDDAGLGASEAVAARLGVDRARLWGMSPFGGSTTDEVWRVASIRSLLRPGQHCSNMQAAFRAAYELPQVHHMAVGTRSAEHLSELVAATTLGIDDHALSRYRGLISTAASSP